MNYKYQNKMQEEQRKTEKWLPKIIRVNDIYGGANPELSTSKAAQEGKKVTIIEIIEEESNIGIGGSRYEHITKKKIEDVLMNRLMKVPFFPIYFYVRIKNIHDKTSAE